MPDTTFTSSPSLADHPITSEGKASFDTVSNFKPLTVSQSIHLPYSIELIIRTAIVR